MKESSPFKKILAVIDGDDSLFDRGDDKQHNVYRFLCHVSSEEQAEIYINPQHKRYKDLTQDQIYEDILLKYPENSYNIILAAMHKLIYEKEETSFGQRLRYWIKTLPKTIQTDVKDYTPPPKKINIAIPAKSKEKSPSPKEHEEVQTIPKKSPKQAYRKSKSPRKPTLAFRSLSKMLRANKKKGGQDKEEENIENEKEVKSFDGR